MGLASPSEGYPGIKFAVTHLYTWLERGTVRVKCLTHEHNTMSLALGLKLRLLDLEFSALNMRPLFVNSKKMEC